MTAPTSTKSTAPPKLTKADRDRIKAIQESRKAYDAAFDPPLVKEDNPVAWIASETTPDFNVIIPRSTAVVDVGQEFLFGEPFTLEVDPKRTPNAKAAQQYLDDAWGDPDDMMTFFSEVGLNGSVGGQGIVKVLPDEQDGAPPEFSATEPEYVSVLCDQHNRRKAIGYQIRYLLTDNKTTFCEYISQTGSQDTPWLIQDYQTTGVGENWQLTNEIEWPYPFAPLQDCQNLTETKEYWGKSDLPAPIIGLNKALNLNASNANKIIWHMAYAWVYGSGFEGDLEVVPGRVVKFASPDGKLVAVNLPNDLPSLMTFMANLRADMDEVTGVPSVATGRVAELPRGQISGTAIEMLYQRLVAKTKKKRRLYGRLIRKLSKIILYFGGFDPDGDTCRVKINWPNLLPIDEFQSWQGGQIQDALGVAKHTIFGSRNISYDTNRELLQQEAQDQQEDFDAGQGPRPPTAPEQPGQQPGQPPMSPEMQQNAQQQPPEVLAQQQLLKSAAGAPSK